MKYRLAGLGLVMALLGLAADNRLAVGQGANENLDIRAMLYLSQKDIKELIGEDLESGIVVVGVKITPKDGKPIEMWRENFLLRSDKDGQRSEPYDPSQIAGSSVLEVTSTSRGNSISQEQRGPVWGGVGEPPRRLPGPGTVVGLNAGDETIEAKVGDGEGEPESELLAVLERKVLQEAEVTEPVSGLLYFPLDGRHKIKQLELHYRGEAGTLSLRFKRPKR